MPGSNLLALGVFLIVFACIATAIMVARGDADTRRLEGRIRSFNANADGPGSATGLKAPPRNIRKTTGGAPLARALERVGRSRHIPKDRRMPWQLVLVGGVAAAAGATYFGVKIAGAALAPLFGLFGALFLVRTLFRMESARYQTKLFRQLPDAMA